MCESSNGCVCVCVCVCVKAAMEATLVGQEFISNLHLSTSAYSSLKM